MNCCFGWAMGMHALCYLPLIWNLEITLQLSVGGFGISVGIFTESRDPFHAKELIKIRYLAPKLQLGTMETNPMETVLRNPRTRLLWDASFDSFEVLILHFCCKEKYLEKPLIQAMVCFFRQRHSEPLLFCSIKYFFFPAG